jgi:hypothetical protein
LALSLILTETAHARDATPTLAHTFARIVFGIRVTGIAMRFPKRLRCKALSSKDIDAMCDCLKVCWVAADPRMALMIKLKSTWYFANKNLIRHLMCPPIYL